MSTNREEFEKWARSVSDNYFPDFSADGISDGGYWQIRTDTAWKGSQQKNQSQRLNRRKAV